MSQKEKEIQEQLAKPFTVRLEDGREVSDLNWRVTATFQDSDKDTFAEYSPYITAPTVRERLNNVVGVFGWEVSFEEMSSNNGMICNLTVNGNSKSGIGSCHKSPQDVDPDKTKESDSLKRASIGFGIGSYVKQIKPITLKIKKSGGKFSHAYSTDGKIKLFSPDQINAYINQISLPLLQLNSALQTLDKDVIEANRDSIKIVWDLLK